MKFGFKSYYSAGSLISSILFFILGAVMFTNPDTMITIVSTVFGAIIIIFGAYNCIKNYTELRKDNTTTSTGMVVGIVSIVIGLVFIFLAGVIEALVRIAIGGWILFCGINRLINALSIKDKKKLLTLLFIALLLIAAGLYTILESNLAFKTIGIVLMIYAFLEIFGYIFNKKEVVVKEEKSKSQKNKDVIDAVVIEDKTNDKKAIEDKKNSK